jgi:tRNA 2-thiocytidine biosynthesis protein TtcA
MSAVISETGAATAATGHAAADSVKKAQKLAFENNKLEKRLCRLTGQAIGDYNMIEQGDRDQKQPGFPEHVLPDYFRAIGVDFHIENQDTYSIVKRVVPEGKTTCSLCSRLRRGILYRVAGELGATKIALGHHRDDIIETLFLNMFYGGKLKGMPPKLQSDDGKNVVIRPLAYVREPDLERYAEYKQFPIIPCTLCGSQPNLKRAEMKALIRQWEKQHPGRIKSIFSALSNVIPSHLMDTGIHDFKNLRATGQPDPLGDTAFDEVPCGDENDAGIIRIAQFDD